MQPYIHEVYMFRNLASLAVIKTIAGHQNNQFIELLIPLIASLLINKYNDKDEVDLNTLCKQFNNEFFIDIPYLTMQYVLNKASSSKFNLIEFNNKKYYVNLEHAEKLSIISELEIQTTNYENIITELNSYISANNYNDFIDRAEDLLFYFFKKIDFDNFYKVIVNGNSLDTDTKKKKLYIVSKFLVFAKKEKPNIFNCAVDIYIGYLLTKTFQVDDIDKYNQPLSNLTIYLDTKFFINILDPEEQELSLVYLQYLETLKEHGIQLHIFDHTMEEVLNILDQCLNYIDNFNPYRSFPLLNSYHYSNKVKEDILNDIVLFKSYLSQYEIEVVEATYFEQFHKYQIDVKLLEEVIIETYKENQTNYELTQSREDAIKNDIKSIEYVYKMRQGKRPTSLKDCKAIFLTVNRGLAKAVSKFDKAGNHYISTCLTDEFFNVLLWIQNPQKMSELSERKFTFQCTAMIKPNISFRKKFYTEVEKLNTKYHYSKDYLLLLKNEQILSNLFNESLGEEKTITEESIQEATSRYLELARKEGEVEASTEIMLKIEEKKNNCSKILYQIMNVAMSSSFVTILIVLFFKFSHVYNFVDLILTCIGIFGLSILWTARNKLKSFASKVCSLIYKI